MRTLSRAHCRIQVTPLGGVVAGSVVGGSPGAGCVVCVALAPAQQRAQGSSSGLATPPAAAAAAHHASPAGSSQGLGPFALHVNPLLQRTATPPHAGLAPHTPVTREQQQATELGASASQSSTAGSWLSTLAQAALPLAAVTGGTTSVASQASGHSSGPARGSSPVPPPTQCIDAAATKPLLVILQVTPESQERPVALILMHSAPLRQPAVLGQIVLASDPLPSDINLSIDPDADLAFTADSFLGAGAFGQVHRAIYKGTCAVAVKMLTDPGVANPDPETLKGFREELGILARLRHPNILRCFGGNLAGPTPFICVELCITSLDRVIAYNRKQRGTGLPLRHTLNVGLHVSSALWALHPSIVHRDLKPANVLVDAHGTAKVADFGLSRIKLHTYLTTQHKTAGTAPYMAPECFAGEQVGVKADIWALGGILLECVSGERPWLGLNVVQTCFQVAVARNTPALPPVGPDCPPELVSLISDCFAFNPRERPASGEVMKALAHMIRLHFPDDT